MGQDSVCFWIIDDDLPFGKSIKRMLNAKGISAEYFGSAESFLDSVPPGQRGFAIVDIHMPSCDGFGLMARMQGLKYDIPVIMVTGQADSEARAKALQCGAVGFLQKPFSEESLMELITKQESGQSAS